MELSIIIPMFNAEQYLNDLFSTISNFDNRLVEIILVDDGSNDQTFNLCKEFQKGKKNIKVYHNDNHGVSFTRNFGISKSKGKYLMFVDADDLLLNKSENIILKAISNYKNADMIIFSKNFKNDCINRKNLIYSIIGISEQYKNCYLQTPWSKIYSRNFIEENNIKFDETIIHGEDALYNIECILKAKNIFTLSDSVYKYRICGSSATHNFNCYFLDSNICYLEKLKKLLESSDEFMKNEICECIKLSFQNSLYIFVGKLSKIDDFAVQNKVISDFYKKVEYLNLLKLKQSKHLDNKKKIVLYVVKYKLISIFEILIKILRHKKHNDPSYQLIEI
ncbi:MAG: glycosyltransferase family 2 protein [Longibaculum sp.]